MRKNKLYNVFVENIEIDDFKRQLAFLYNLPSCDEAEGIINVYEYIREKIETENDIKISIKKYL